MSTICHYLTYLYVGGTSIVHVVATKKIIWTSGHSLGCERLGMDKIPTDMNASSTYTYSDQLIQVCLAPMEQHTPKFEHPKPPRHEVNL